MKTFERKEALKFRRDGMSMNDIARQLGVAKSSVSNWVRDVRLTEAQRDKLTKNGFSIEAIEKRRIARIQNTRQKRDSIMQKAKREVVFLAKDPFWCVGVALYWGEGGKTQQTARLSNSDPHLIKFMMRFFKDYSGVQSSSYRAHVHTFSKRNALSAVEYWSKISGIPKRQFFKTYIKKSSASRNKRETLPYGTVQIYVHNTQFFFRLMGWIEKLKEVGAGR